MSNLKYDNETCGSIIELLEYSENMLEQAETEIRDYYRNVPTSDEINARIKKLSLEIDDYGNEIESLTASNESYYMNNFGTPLKNARTNMVRMNAATFVVRENVKSVDTKVKNIETAVSEYEEKTITEEYDKGALNIPSEIPYDPGTGGTGLDFGDSLPVGVDFTGFTEGDGTGNENQDTEGVTISNINVDTDGDGKPDLNVDTNGDGIPDINIDTNGDGKPDLNVDTNGDLVPDVNIDTNGDGKPDLNVDTNSDKVPDVNIDTNNDGKPDTNIDTNNDGVPDVNIDSNGDGKPDTNIDTNNDGVPDVNIDSNGDGKPDRNIDTNGDGIPDINIDSDGNGYPDTNIDINGDGIPDINIDTDGDGIPDKNVIPGYEHGVSEDGNFLEDLIKRMKLQVDDDGNIMYYDENGNIVYPFLGDGIFADPANAQKFKMAENAFLEMLDGPEKGDAVESLDVQLEDQVSSASLALGGMAAVGAAAANAAVTMKRTKDEINEGVRVYDYEYDDDAILTPEQYKKRKTGTIISMVVLTLLILANFVAVILNSTTDVTIVLLGLSIAITAIITSMGIKLGKFYTICAILVNQLIVFILTCLGLSPSLGYIIAFAVIIVVFLYYYFTKLFERILPMFNYVPAVVGIVAIGFVGLLGALDVTHWILNTILFVLIVVGYFAYNYYGIAQLEEQMELEKQKGLSIYDYFSLKTNRKQWKYRGNIEETTIIPQTKKEEKLPDLPKKHSNKKYGKHGDNKFLEYMDGTNQDSNKKR